MTRKEAQKRAAELSQHAEGLPAGILRREPAACLRCRVRPPVRRACRRSRHSFPTWPCPILPPGASGPTSPRTFPEAAHTIPVLSLDKSYTAGGAVRVDRQDGAQRGTRALVRLRGKDRRRVDGALLREGRPRPRRDAGKRAGRQRRHREREDHRRRSAAPSAAR